MLPQESRSCLLPKKKKKKNLLKLQNWGAKLRVGVSHSAFALLKPDDSVKDDGWGYPP